MLVKNSAATTLARPANTSVGIGRVKAFVDLSSGVELSCGSVPVDVAGGRAAVGDDERSRCAAAEGEAARGAGAVGSLSACAAEMRGGRVSTGFSSPVRGVGTPYGNAGPTLLRRDQRAPARCVAPGAQPPRSPRAAQVPTRWAARTDCYCACRDTTRPPGSLPSTRTSPGVGRSTP